MRPNQNAILMTLAFMLLSTACTKNVFRTATDTTETKAPVVVGEQEPIATTSTTTTTVPSENISDSSIDASFKGGFESKELSPNTKNDLWIATANGLAQHLIVENGVIKSKKAWSGMAGGGTRTYVLEGGAAIMGKNGGAIYFLHDAVAEGAISLDPANGVFYQLQGAAGGDRTCLVSYRKNGKRMIGMAWGAGNFSEVEQDDKPPYGPKFATITAPVKAGPLAWGYSCYIDQNRLQFYSQYYQGATQGLDLKTMLPLDLSKAPNNAFASTNLPNLTVGAKNLGNGSYAMSGDRVGNVFNGVGVYTMAFEAKSATVWASSGTNLTIMPGDCLSKTAECKGFATYNMADTIGAGLGPLSAMGDGAMVGMVRGVGDVYLLKLKVPTDATKGIDAVKLVANVGGDPYMYTDFTGATLYMNSSLNEFTFTNSAKFDATAPIRQLGFSWAPVEGNTSPWQDIKAEVRCYSDPANKGDFQEVAITAAARAVQFIDVASCANKIASQAEVRLTQQNNSSSLMGIAKIQMTAFQ